MVETKGSVKLFGVTIKVAAPERWDLPAGGDPKGLPVDDDNPLKESKGEEEQVDSGDSSEPTASSVETEHNEATTQADEEHTAGNSPRSDGKQDAKSSGTQEKPLKKPTEILPCPRCHSLDTKFCYFNNYNVGQPRHFCKACQRYWTDGGTMRRNMAVGAGRRKSKCSTSQYKHTALLSAALQSIPSDILIAFNHPEQEADGAAPILGSGFFPVKSGEQFVSLDRKAAEVNCDKKACEGVKGILVYRPSASHRVPNSGAPLMSYSRSKGHEGPVLQGFQAYQLHASGGPNRVPLSSQFKSNPGHALSTPYAPPSFRLMNPDQKSSCASGSLELPALKSMACIAMSTGGGPSTINKYSRDGSVPSKKRDMPCDDSGHNSQEKGLRMPERIEDPNEAAKSSVWTAMRNKGAASGGFCFRGLSIASQPKGENMDERKEVSDALHANPSAWLRSLEFHENIQWRKDRVSVGRQG